MFWHGMDCRFFHGGFEMNVGSLIGIFWCALRKLLLRRRMLELSVYCRNHIERWREAVKRWKRCWNVKVWNQRFVNQEFLSRFGRDVRLSVSLRWRCLTREHGRNFTLRTLTFMVVQERHRSHRKARPVCPRPRLSFQLTTRGLVPLISRVSRLI